MHNPTIQREAETDPCGGDRAKPSQDRAIYIYPPAVDLVGFLIFQFVQILYYSVKNIFYFISKSFSLYEFCNSKSFES